MADLNETTVSKVHMKRRRARAIEAPSAVEQHFLGSMQASKLKGAQRKKRSGQ